MGNKPSSTKPSSKGQSVSTPSTSNTTPETTLESMTPPSLFASGVLVDRPASSSNSLSGIVEGSSKKQRRIVKASPPAPLDTSATSAKTGAGSSSSSGSPVIVPSSVEAPAAGAKAAKPAKKGKNDDNDEAEKRRRHNATLVQSPAMVARDLQEESIKQHRQERFQSHLNESKNSREREIFHRRHGGKATTTGGGGDAAATANPFTRFLSAFYVDNATHHKRRRGGKVAQGETGDDVDNRGTSPPAEKRLRSDDSGEIDKSPTLLEKLDKLWDDFGVKSRTGAAVTAAAVAAIVVFALTGLRRSK